MVLTWKDIYIENIRIVLLIAGLKMEEIVKWRGITSQGPVPVFDLARSCGVRYSIAVHAYDWHDNIKVNFMANQASDLLF